MKSKEAIVHCGKLGKMSGRVLDVNTPSLWRAAKRSSSEVVPPVRRFGSLAIGPVAVGDVSIQ
jgi:hypothetical protein